MALNDKRSIIDGHLNTLNENEKNNKGILFATIGIIAACAVGLFAFTTPESTAMNTVDQGVIEVTEEEAGSKMLASDKIVIEDLGLVATIQPTEEQWRRLQTAEDEETVVVEEDMDASGLTQEEIRMLEDATTAGEIIVDESTDLPAPFNNDQIGISNETFSAEQVEHLNMVTTGYVIKKYKGQPVEE